MSTYELTKDAWRRYPCIIFQGAIRADGYGICSYNEYAHRRAFFKYYGKYPVNECCHHCDVRSCIHPMHLFDGTQGENIRDSVRKGRHSSLFLHKKEET